MHISEVEKIIMNVKQKGKWKNEKKIIKADRAWGLKLS